MTTDPESTIDLLDNLPNAQETLEAADLPALTVFDHCDAAGCTSQAYVRAKLPSGSELLFCAHHGHDLTPALVGRGAVIRDDSHLLTANRML